MYDNYNKFTDGEAKRVLKNPLWKNLHIIQNAMNKTATTFTPGTRAKTLAARKILNVTTRKNEQEDVSLIQETNRKYSQTSLPVI